MNAELLIAHFNRISDAPDAVPRLRRFILDLAVRGKLVAQDANDEPASELLRQIRLEKMRLTREGGHKGEGASVPVELDENPFSLPSNWEWVKLIDLLTKLTDGTHHSPTNLAQGDFKYITAKNIKPEGISLEELTYISEDVHQAIYSRCNPELGDILYIKDGATTGVVTINNLDEPFSMLSSVALLKLSNGAYNRLIVEFLRSPFFYSQMRGFMKGAAITRVTLKRMAPALIPLPPRAEQYRIVAKVDELMALCDRLEAAQRERESQRDRLTAATHHHLNNGADAEALRSHAQFLIGHLPRLTARPDQIKQLRQTILNLAVRGKLVPQIDGDEPVSVLLRRIEAEQKDLIRQREIKAKVLSSSIPEDEALIEIPQTWRFTSLGRLIVFGPQNGISPTSSSRPDAPRAITLTATTSGIFKSGYSKQIEANIPHESEFWLRKGDLLFQRGNTREYVGMAAYYAGEDGQFLYPDLIIKVRVSKSVDLRFLHLCSTAPYARTYFGRRASGAQATMPKINHDILLTLPIPIPPLAEQHRIVAKVDELMALCDQLEARLTTAQTEASRLLESVLHNALNSQAERFESALST